MHAVDYAENAIRTGYPKTFKAHGAEWTIETGHARIAELEAKNLEIGPSDGRVTEIHLIREAMASYIAAREAKKWEIVRSCNIADYTHKLEQLGTTPEPTDRTIVYIDNAGHRRHGRYTTEQGFYRALLRIETKRQDLIWAE